MGMLEMMNQKEKYEEKENIQLDFSNILLDEKY